MSLTKDELKSRFQTSTKEVEVKAWGGSVTIRKLTISEKNQLESLALRDATNEDIKNGEIKINLGDSSKITVMAVSFALVEPKMKVVELEALNEEAFEGVAAIKKALDEWDKPKKSQEGKDTSK